MKKSTLFGLCLFPLFAFANTDCITPVKGPLPNHSADIVLDGEFLYWYSSLSNTSPYIVYEFVNPGDTSDEDQDLLGVPKKIKEFNWSWDPGFRIGLGVVTNHDGWDLYGDWTYYYNSVSISQSEPNFVDDSSFETLGGKYLSSMWFTSGADEKYQTIHAHWKLQLNEIDLQLGRNFWISKTLTLRPHFGVHTHLSTTELKVKGNYFSLLDDSDRERVESQRLKQKYWGVGLAGGIDTAWHITKNWSVFANGDLSLVYGRCSLSRKLFMYLVSLDENQVPFVRGNETIDVQFDGQYRTQAIFDFAAGLRFETLIANNGCRLLFDLGWEHHFYPDFAKFGRNAGNDLDEATYFPIDGNLTTGGVVFKARFEF